ncbi:hypothetical protein GCM10010425_43190 [Streptomyces spororaveus]|uniref:Uncharacterized protein n=1 Tax=Streptomyces spororaveus TaxID=284039 RepID=A0ABQ3TMV1_9ACTN|nr:hypothetical protein Sspor_72490 [Streptomyces spororaveus]
MQHVPKQVGKEFLQDEAAAGVQSVGMPGMGSAAPGPVHADHPVAVNDDDFTVEL